MEISIIIPTYNRADSLKITLHSIESQNDSTDYEVIVIDNGSTDQTRKVCEEFTEISKDKYRYYYDATPGLLTGRQLGTTLATGEIICFLDDDVELSPSWIEGVKEAFKNNDIQLATGPSLPAYSTHPPSWLKYFWRREIAKGASCVWLSLINLGDKKLFVNPNYVWGLNFCIRKTALIKLGGFHPDNIPSNLQIYQGDGETGLTMKAHQAGCKALYHPQIKLHHLISAERLTIEYFRKRAFYQGVCNSFTLLRRRYAAPVTNKKSESINLMRKVLQRVKKWLSLFERIFLPKEVQAIMFELEHEERNGFRFHQNAFANNRKVKEWVLKKDYIDYRLPN